MSKISHLKEKSASFSCSFCHLQPKDSNQTGVKTHVGGFGYGSYGWPAWVGFVPQGGVGGQVSPYTFIIFNRLILDL